ncbi:hypothetical protein CcCBS67573_g03943 [Chytriomyces confervae]|uniref:Uncharacterized protein n=1 Tax=Chytriomyces confervae TaxID=246404 RepID=A0A507FEL1_9FUNG|nr:hypothetical protein CcCBS67573_g03943 [Chytriomyces confervae]
MFTKTRTRLLVFYALTVLLGSIVTPPQTWLANKRNLLNVVFAKFAWGWTTLVIVAAIAVSSFARPGQQSPPQSGTSTTTLHRLALHTRTTLFWIITTQYFLGPPLLDRVYMATGSCVAGEDSLVALDAAALASPKMCKRAGGQWSGFDISGHCLLLILAGVSIHEQVRMSKKATKLLREGSAEKRYVDWSIAALRFFQLLWWIMLVTTALYFHDIPELYSGTTLAGLYWAAEYAFLL